MGKIPDHARQVFHGVRYDVYQWEQELYDGTTKMFEAVKRPDTVEALVIVGDKILIQEEEQPHVPRPFLSLPGGCVDEGEDHETAMSRELLEETGYAVETWELFHAQAPLQSVQWDMYVYIGRGARRMTEPHPDAGERITPRLVSFHELLDLVDRGELYRFEQTLRFLLLRAAHDRPMREALQKRLFGSL